MNWLEWYNFIFALPLAVGLLLSLGVVFAGVGTEHDSSHHSGDHAGDHHGHGEQSPMGQIAAFFGFGQGTSLTLLVPLLLAAWGLSGLLGNQVMGRFLPPAVYFPISALLGLVVAALSGRSIAGLVRRLALDRKSAVGEGGLRGCGGRAVFAITQTGGVANVRDRFGNIHRIVCQTLSGEADIPADAEILVVDFDREKKVYLVQAHPFADQK